MRKQGVGNPSSGSGFPIEMHGMRTSDHGAAQNGRKKYEKFTKAGVNSNLICFAYIKYTRDEIYI